MQDKKKLKKNIDNLKNRAAKRRLTYPAHKDTKDISVENSNFADIKKQIYKQIAR